jgi:hypothetical protein
VVLVAVALDLQVRGLEVVVVALGPQLPGATKRGVRSRRTPDERES